ncbi:MAG: helix-hairpin-helix domain-containing protein, partial [Pseudomonadota bacterium]
SVPDLADAVAEELASVPGLGGLDIAHRIIAAARTSVSEEGRRQAREQQAAKEQQAKEQQEREQQAAREQQAQSATGMAQAEPDNGAGSARGIPDEGPNENPGYEDSPSESPDEPGRQRLTAGCVVESKETGEQEGDAGIGELLQIPGLDEDTSERLIAAGYGTVEALAREDSVATISAKACLDPEKAQALRDNARAKLEGSVPPSSPS